MVINDKDAQRTHVLPPKSPSNGPLSLQKCLPTVQNLQPWSCNLNLGPAGVKYRACLRWEYSVFPIVFTARPAVWPMLTSRFSTLEPALKKAKRSGAPSRATRARTPVAPPKNCRWNPTPSTPLKLNLKPTLAAVKNYHAALGHRSKLSGEGMGKFGIVAEGLAVTEEERARETGCTGRILRRD
jgi:hypothetical protein